MSLRQVGVLLAHETSHGSRSFFVVFAIVTPLLASAVLSLVFGNLFLDMPALGIADLGRSSIGGLAAEMDAYESSIFVSDSALKDAVERGAVDLGIVLPDGFDDQVQRGDPVAIKAYIWGESLAKNRAILGAGIANLVRVVAGQDSPIDIVSTTLGEDQSIPLNDRVMPFIVLMAVAIGGVMVPAASLVNEKHKGTLQALSVTPTSLEEIVTAKVIMGVALSTAMGVFTLGLNQSFDRQQWLLVAILTLGAVMASVFGVLLGILSKDITALFATIKAIGLLLYAPSIVYFFPGIPQWIGRLFPTYYIVGPVVEISQRGGRWSDVAGDVAILLALIVALVAIVYLVLGRVKRRGF